MRSSPREAAMTANELSYKGTAAGKRSFFSSLFDSDPNAHPRIFQGYLRAEYRAEIEEAVDQVTSSVGSQRPKSVQQSAPASESSRMGNAAGCKRFVHSLKRTAFRSGRVRGVEHVE